MTPPGRRCRPTRSNRLSPPWAGSAFDDIVAQLAVDGAVFWVARADDATKRLSPDRLGGATGRMLLVVDNPKHVVAAAVREGARETAGVQDEHGWRLGRIVDPLFCHEWEVGRLLGAWPPAQ